MRHVRPHRQTTANVLQQQQSQPPPTSIDILKLYMRLSGVVAAIDEPTMSPCTAPNLGVVWATIGSATNGPSPGSARFAPVSCNPPGVSKDRTNEVSDQYSTHTLCYAAGESQRGKHACWSLPAQSVQQKLAFCGFERWMRGNSNPHSYSWLWTALHTLKLPLDFISKMPTTRLSRIMPWFQDDAEVAYTLTALYHELVVETGDSTDRQHLVLRNHTTA